MKGFKATKDFVLLSVFVSIILLLSLIPQIGYVTILPGVSVTLVHIPVLVGISLFRKLKPSLILGFAFGVSSFVAALIYAQSPFDLAFQLPWIPIIPRVLFALAAYYILVLFGKIEGLKNGKVILFIASSVITAAGLYFGVDAASTVASQTLGDTFKIVARIVSIVVIIGFIYLFYRHTFKKTQAKVYLTPAFIISTLIHTVLVIMTVAVFRPSAFIETFGGDQGAIFWMYTLATSNGLIEAIVALLVGVPIVIALLQVKESEEQ